MRKPRRISFTKEGLEELKKKHQEFLTRRPQAVQNLKQARELGDLSENGLYKAARAELTSIDAQLRRLDYMIKLARIPEIQIDTAGIGSLVELKDKHGLKEITLVGEFEADPKNGKISVNSPVGKSVQGKKVGETVTVHTPTGVLSYTLTKITIP